MYDRRSIYALNKKNPDAIVLPDADGNLICLTCADFTDEAEFRRWKRWSDQDFHAEDKSDVEESDLTTSMDMVPEAALAVPNGGGFGRGKAGQRRSDSLCGGGGFWDQKHTDWGTVLQTPAVLHRRENRERNRQSRRRHTAGCV